MDPFCLEVGDVVQIEDRDNFEVVLDIYDGEGFNSIDSTGQVMQYGIDLVTSRRGGDYFDIVRWKSEISGEIKKAQTLKNFFIDKK